VSDTKFWNRVFFSSGYTFPQLCLTGFD